MVVVRVAVALAEQDHSGHGHDHGHDLRAGLLRLRVRWGRGVPASAAVRRVAGGDFVEVQVLAVAKRSTLWRGGESN